MREIKFRAWNSHLKKMSRPMNLHEIETEWPAANVWMQYTGLHDKNGKEIYEGDILEFRLNTKYGFITKRGVVEWQACSFHVLFLPKHQGEQDGLYSVDFCVEATNIGIIGNIYENPELLEEK